MTEPKKKPHDNETDWIDRVASTAKALGFNEIRVRWKLERLRRKWSRFVRRAEQQKDHLKYKHKVCSYCGRVNDRHETDCVGCGKKLSSYKWHVLNRIGLSTPQFMSVSMLIGICLVLVHVRLLMAQGGGLSALWSTRIDIVYRFGGHWPPAVSAGEWWRLGTSIFLHYGLWHIGFNMFALSQIGPAMEEIFGAPRMVLIFMITGIAANLGSGLMGLSGVSAGASGAIMGLCGLAAGWGRRDATTVGKNMRNLMLKWGIYTLVFGFFIRADNWAHFFGFLSGGIIGVAIPPAWLRRSSSMAVRTATGLAGTCLLVAGAALALFPPQPKMVSPFLNDSSFRKDVRTADFSREYTREARAACALLESGRSAEAIARYNRFVSKRTGQRHTKAVDQRSMEILCVTRKKLREQCVRFKEGGIEVVFEGRQNLPEDPAELKRLEAHYREGCRTWLID